jgi:pimeloyl-ACP methyl ester carboxylesterase
MTRIVYLHGFASGPNSSKAQFFKQRFHEIGVPIEIPRLDGGDFQALTLTGQLRIIDETVANQPAILFGSSLGGYLAALYAARRPELIEKLVLLAPAFQFPSRWRKRYSADELDRWRREGSTPVFHYGENRVLHLGYQFLEDSSRFEEEPDARQPILIFHGTKDDVVPYVVSETFCASHPDARLHLMDSGHELTNVLNPMWEAVEDFLC